MMDDGFVDDDDPAFHDASKTIDIYIYISILFNDATASTAVTATISITFAVIDHQQRPWIFNIRQSF
jgi:hypothetical protein